MLLDILKIIIISVVEGITEFIPVSSTGHILIVEGLLKPFSNEQFRNSFAFVIQLGAIMSVVFVYWKRIFPFIGTAEEQKAKWNMWFKIFVAIIPAVFLIFPIVKMQGDKVSLDDLTEKFLYNPLPIAIALIVYGIILIVIENKNKGKKAKINSIGEISYLSAFGVGVFQCLASIPGTSRSAATIIGGMLLGFNRVVATEFSFFLAIPTMLGASANKLMKRLGNLSTTEVMYLLLGAFISFVVSLIVIKFFMEYIRNKDFKIFGYYRIILGIVVIILMALHIL